MNKEKLENEYEQARTITSDIYKHVPRLRDLAAQCEHVTEFGVRNGVSTAALLSGALDGELTRLVSYEKRPTGREKVFTSIAPDHFHFIKGDSREVEIEETDMLFIDTRHTYAQLRKELFTHHEKVRRWIVLHDTVLFGHRDEGSLEGNGLLHAMFEFLGKNGTWFISEHYEYNNGLTVLSRNDDDVPSIYMWRR